MATILNLSNLKRTVLNTIKEHHLIEHGDYVFLGLSGGPDSLCLLHVLMELRYELGFEMSAIHVNHGIRGEAAKEDAMWVVNYCNKIGVSCTRVEANVPFYAEKLHLTEEEAGRRVRREIFAYMAYGMMGENVHEKHPAWPLRNAYKGPGGIKAAPKAVKIALAHNMDDQAETVLMRILRGTGVHGLTGIQYESPLVDALQRVGWGIRNPLLQQNAKDLDISIIRPLLDVPRTEIENYCTEKQLQPRIDHTNQETEYTRNKIRLELLPMLEEKYNPNIKETLVRLAANAAEDDAALARISAASAKDAEKVLSLAAFRPQEPAAPGNFSVNLTNVPRSRDPRAPKPLLSSIALDASALRAMDPAVFKRVIVSEFDKLGLTEGISAVHLNALYSAVQKNIGGKTIEFPAGHTAELRAGTLTLK
ncbi:MAG: tRNA lysidine(34) synthetase TilS [Firmicutes bacterium]|nr:tRNA lysidine(34) synthetase TilS [Bacillota bacterium]